MIKSIKIKNVQAHTDTRLKLSPGVNVIVGSSNSGKSAIIRAILWCVYNRPTGTDILLSDSALNAKGKQVEDMSVSITTDKGTCTRLRGKDCNQYELDGTVFEALKTDVPEQVQKFFNFQDVNVQKQMDSPFLLTRSNGEIAKFFNTIAHVDIIDSVLGRARELSRESAARLKVLEEDIAAQQKVVSDTECVEKLEADYKRLESLADKVEHIDGEWDSVSDLRERYSDFAKVNPAVDMELVNSLQTKLANLNSVGEKQRIVGDLAFRFEDLGKRKPALVSSKKLEALGDAVHERSKLDADGAKVTALKLNYGVYSFRKEIKQKFISDLEGKLNDFKGLHHKMNMLLYHKKMYEEYGEELEECRKIAKKLNALMPKVCPYCGSKMHG